MSKPDQSLRDVFLSQFSTRMRERICEFGKELEALEADIVITMARKASCLVDCLQRLNLTCIGGIVTSERALDMPTDWLSGKRVALVDDALISGSTLYRAQKQVSASGAELISTRVVCVNKRYWNPTVIQPARPYAVLSDPEIGAFCANLVRALSLFPRPYGVDYPIYGNLRVPLSNLNSIGRLSGWSTYDFTDSVQRSYDVLSLVAEPSQAARHALDHRFRCALSHFAPILKVRIYGRVVSANNAPERTVALRVMPVVALDPMHCKDVFLLWTRLVGCRDLYSSQLDAAFGSSVIPRLRFIQYFMACQLAQLWFNGVDQSLAIQLSLEQELSSLLALFPPHVASQLLMLTDSVNASFAGGDLPVSTAAPITNVIPRRIPNHKDPWTAQARLLEPFLWLYDTQEKAARETVLANGRHALDRPEEYSELDRLNRGISLPELRLRAGDVGDGRTSSQAVSAFLDVSIDRGFIVPITVEHDSIVYRAYRHGEDVKDSEQLRRLALVAVKSFADAAAVPSVPRTWTEKLLVLLIKLLIDKKLQDPSDSMLGAYGTIGVRYDLHGPVLKRQSDKLYSIHNQRTFTRLLCDCGYLTELAGGYTVARFPADIPEANSQVLEAAKLGSSLGMLYQPIPNAKVSPALNLDELVYLACCANPQDIAGALAAELDLFQYHWTALQSWQSAPDFEAAAADATLRYIRRSIAFKAINSGKAKWVAYTNSAPALIISRIQSSLASDPSRQLLWRDLWAARTDHEREEIPEALQELVQREGELIMLLGLLFRMLEYLYLSVLPKDPRRRGRSAVRNELDEYCAGVRAQASAGLPMRDKILSCADWLRDPSRDMTPELIRKTQQYVTEELSYCCHVCHSLLAEVDGIAARYGRPPAMERFEQALVYELKSVNAVELTDLVAAADRLIGTLRIAAKRGQGPTSLEPIQVPWASDDATSATRWVFARGPHARRELVRLATLLEENVLARCGGRVALLCDLERFEQPVVVGYGNIVRSGNFWTRASSILTTIQWRPGHLAAFSPHHRYREAQWLSDVAAATRNTWTAEVTRLDWLSAEPVPQVMTRLRIKRTTNRKERSMYDLANVGVVTVIPSEGGAVVKRMRRLDGYVMEFQGRYYHAARLAASCGGTHTLAMTSAVDQGQVQAMPAFYSMIEKFDPQLLVLLGVAGSIRDDVSLGDVVIAQNVISYQKVKEIEDGTHVRRGATFPPKRELVVHVNEFLMSFGTPPSLTRKGSRFPVHFDPIGTGNAVVGNRLSQIRHWLSIFNDKVAAVETEAEGPSELLAQSTLGPLGRRLQGLLVIRGISDHADRFKSKGDDLQPQAALNAFETLIALLRSMPTFDARAQGSLFSEA